MTLQRPPWSFTYSFSGTMNSAEEAKRSTWKHHALAAQSAETGIYAGCPAETQLWAAAGSNGGRKQTQRRNSSAVSRKLATNNVITDANREVGKRYDGSDLSV